jgi:prepilin-type N-terminal cleavage/methylation domain-containing protein
MSRRSFRDGFTLIELLVVIAIIAILSVVVILTLNPAALLQQSRDSNRISDMSTLNTALGVYLAQGASSLGSSSVVYISIPDPTATTTAGDQCQGLGLITLPATYSYHCAATSTYRSVDGTGWIPVNFTSLPAGSPLGQLPIDPINTSSSREYYTYTTNGTQYETTAAMESAKYKLGGSNDVISNDGGHLATVYEKGNAYGLEPLDYGDTNLAGYWNFNEGTGNIAYDESGNGDNGTWSGSVINGSHYTTGKIGPYAGNFLSANSNVVTTSFQYSLTTASNFTWAAWIDYVSSGGGQTTLIGNRAGSTWIKVTPSAFEFSGVIMSYVFPTNAWSFVVVTKSGTNFNYYLNGTVVASTTSSNTITSNPFYMGGDPNYAPDGYMTGAIDDVRIYTRTLSAAEVTAMYNGGK